MLGMSDELGEDEVEQIVDLENPETAAIYL